MMDAIERIKAALKHYDQMTSDADDAVCELAESVRAAIKAAAEQEPVAMVDVEDWGHNIEVEYLDKLRKLPSGRYALYTHPITSEDKWKEAIWHECMMTEAVAPNENDPIGTLKALVSYHVDLAFSEDSERLQSEIQRLQTALAFWLPSVPANNSEAAERCGDDAMLLVGLTGPTKPSAEELGWITFHDAAEG